jgi:hypothetical protein
MLHLTIRSGKQRHRKCESKRCLKGVKIDVHVQKIYMRSKIRVVPGHNFNK